MIYKTYVMIKPAIIASIFILNCGLVIAQDNAEENYIETLKKYSQYSEKEFASIPDFTYQSETSIDLINLRQKYNLDSIAGKGDELSQIINLMKWTHTSVPHSPTISGDFPKCMSALCLIDYCKTNNTGLPCYLISLVQNDVYLSMGFKSKYVFCLPDEKEISDNHVINIVYSKTLKKWIWMDPTFEVYMMDSNNNLLDVNQVRQRMIDNKNLTVSEGFNENGKPEGGSAWYIKYMSKNLFRFIIPIRSQSDYESSNMPSYIELLPLGYNAENVPIGEKINKGTGYKYYIDNEKQFWK
jgi:hypothetical protein